MMNQSFGFSPLPPFAAAGWPPLPGGDLVPAVASLLALLQAPSLATSSWAPDDVSEAFLRDITGATLRRLYRQLETAGPRHTALAACYAPLHQAVHAYRAQDYVQSLNTAYQVYRVIAAQQSRHLDPPDSADRAPSSGEPTAQGS